MTEFAMPPVRRLENGDERRVGFEIEYAGVGMEDSAAIVRDIVGGQLQRSNPFHFDIVDGELGDFIVEVDARLLHEQKYEEHLRRIGIDIDKLDLRAPLEKLLGSMAALMVPQEIVTPPLRLSDMDVIERIRGALFEADARGTGASVLYGFGVHINADLPSRSAPSLLAHLRAFCLLYDWICKHWKIDWSRRIGPFINPYPQPYVDLIMQADYAPDRSQLAADYIAHMPARDYALDLLPVLVELEGKALLDKIKEPELIKPRPAFHYRLPNCQIGDADWRVAREWQSWVEVERLAQDDEGLRALMQRYRSYQGAWIDPLLNSWPDTVDAFFSSD